MKNIIQTGQIFILISAVFCFLNLNSKSNGRIFCTCTVGYSTAVLALKLPLHSANFLP
jgi:hypothetical protein